VGRKIYITEFGKEITLAAENILNEVNAINYKALSFQGELAGKLTIAIVSTAKYVMPYFLTDFINQHKGVDLSMDVTNKADVVRSLENNEIDFAMVSTIPKHLKINRIQLMDNKLYLVGGKQYKPTGKHISNKEFEQLPLIYREQGSATRKKMEYFIASNKISTYKKMELKSNEALKQAIVAGLGYSIMPLIGIKNELKNGDLQVIPVKRLPMTTDWNLIWLKSKNLSSIAKSFIENINENKDDIIKTHFDWFDSYK
jgi:DNA-binding transcriptional LysR family regulator